MKKPQPVVSKSDRLSYLLGAYGNGAINEVQFWEQMRESKFSQDDIDAWCAEYHSKGSNQ